VIGGDEHWRMHDSGHPFSVVNGDLMERGERTKADIVGGEGRLLMKDYLVEGEIMR
jgi:hypothetical protein